MKKILLLGVIIIIGFGLSGCEFLPEETFDQISEDLCRENPDHELCDLESLDDVEDELVTNLVMDLKETVGDGIDDDCDGIIAPSNPDLLDKCRNGDLFPEGIEDFEVIDVMKTDDTYEVTLKTMNDNEFFKVTFTIVEHEGKEHIDMWDTGQVYIDEDMGEVLDNEMYVKELIADYQLKSKDEFCSIWFDGIDDDCNLVGDTLGMSIFVEIDNIRPYMEMYYEIDVLLGDNKMPDKLYIRLDDDDDGDTILTDISFLDPGMDVPLRDFEQKIEMFINEINGDGDLDVVIANHFRMNYRQEFGPVMVGRELGSPIILEDIIDHSDDLFTVGLKVMIEGKEEMVRLVIKPIRLDLSISYLDIIDPYDFESGTLEETKELFEKLIVDYLDPDVDDDYINEMYFFGLMDESFFIDRHILLESEGSVVLIRIQQRPDLLYDIELDITSEGSTTREGIIVVAKRVDKATPMLMIIGGGDPDANKYDFGHELLKEFVANVNDYMINIEEVCEPFDMENSEMCTEIVTYNRDNQYTLILQDYFMNDEGTILLHLASFMGTEGISANEYMVMIKDGENPLYVEKTNTMVNPIYEGME